MSAFVRQTIAAVILAGGKSTRMGSNKALLSYHGERLIDFMANAIKKMGMPLYVSGKIAPYCCIPDNIANLGPLGGIISVMDFLLEKDIRAALFVPVDMPHMTSQFLIDMITYKNLAEAIHCHQHPLPLLLRFTPKVINALNANKKNHPQDASIRSLINQLNTSIYYPKENEKKALTNVNNPNDWAKIKGYKAE